VTKRTKGISQRPSCPSVLYVVFVPSTVKPELIRRVVKRDDILRWHIGLDVVDVVETYPPPGFQTSRLRRTC